MVNSFLPAPGLWQYITTKDQKRAHAVREGKTARIERVNTMDEKTREGLESEARRLGLLVDYANKLAAQDMAEARITREKEE